MAGVDEELAREALTLALHKLPFKSKFVTRESENEYTELKDKSVAELNALLKEKKVLLFTLRQKLKTMQLSNPNEISAVRKEIAQINTAISATRQGA